MYVIDKDIQSRTMLQWIAKKKDLPNDVLHEIIQFIKGWEVETKVVGIRN